MIRDRILTIGLPRDSKIPNVDYIRGDVFSILTIDLQRRYVAVLLNPSSPRFMRYDLKGTVHRCPTKFEEAKFFKSNKNGLCKLLRHRKYANRQCIKRSDDTSLKELATKHASLIINKLYLSMTTGCNIIIINNPQDPDHFLCRFKPEIPFPHLGKSRQVKCRIEHPIMDAFNLECMSKLGSIIYSEPLPAVSTLRDILQRDRSAQNEFGSDLSGTYHGLETALSKHIVLKPAFTNIVNQPTSIIGLPEDSDGSLMIVPLQPNPTPLIKRLSRTISKLSPNPDSPKHSARSLLDKHNSSSNTSSVPQDDPATISFIESQPLITLRHHQTHGRIEAAYAALAEKLEAGKTEGDFGLEDVSERLEKRQYKVRPLQQEAYDRYISDSHKRMFFTSEYDQKRLNEPNTLPQETIRSIIKKQRKENGYKLDEKQCIKYLCLRKHQRDFFQHIAAQNGPASIESIKKIKSDHGEIFFLHHTTYIDFLTVCPSEGNFPNIPIDPQ